MLLAGISIEVNKLLFETSNVHSVQSLLSRCNCTSVNVQLSIFTSLPPRTWQPVSTESAKEASAQWEASWQRSSREPSMLYVSSEQLTSQQSLSRIVRDKVSRG